MLRDNNSVRDAVLQFAIDGELLSVDQIKRGHIHQTFVSTFRSTGSEETRRFIHQRLNHEVFPDIAGLMENIQRLTRFLAERLSEHGAEEDKVLELISTRDGTLAYRDGEGMWWRTYRFIEDTVVMDRASSSHVAFEAARAFGQFQRDLAEFPAGELHHVIPDFHHTPKRLQAFRLSVEADRAGRAVECAQDIAALEQYAHLAEKIQRPLDAGELPLRVVHNDTKINNVLFSDKTGRGIAVIDLDICMPGSMLFDFGDLARTAATTAAEDEPVLERIGFDLGMFRALVEGTIEGTGGSLTPTEMDLLAVAPQVVTFELATRFFKDYLDGDVYFQTHLPKHNLIRARAQLQLVRLLVGREEEMRAMVRDVIRV